MKKAKEEKFYRIGDFAKYMGVTPDFLKHYEENGLLQVRYRESGYRYYNFDQSSRILEYMRLRNYGVSVKEMNAMLGDDDEAEEALRWYAEHGVAEAQYKLAVATLVYGSTDIPEEEAAGYCTQAAAQGHRAAQELLGECYTDENGVSFSAERAFYWFGKAAAQGDPFSQNKLGDCYFDGEGVKQSFEKAAEWYKKAAIQGESEAMFSLGYLYENGKGTDRDYSEALRWYKMAQARGDGDAAAAIARVEQLIKDHPEYDG